MLCFNALLNSKVSVSCLEVEVRKILLSTGWFTPGNLVLPGRPLNLSSGWTPWAVHAECIGQQFQRDICLKTCSPPKSIFSTFLWAPIRCPWHRSEHMGWGWGCSTDTFDLLPDLFRPIWSRAPCCLSQYLSVCPVPPWAYACLGPSHFTMFLISSGAFIQHTHKFSSLSKCFQHYLLSSSNLRA